MFRKKTLLKGGEKRGEMHIFPSIDLKLKRGWQFLACGAHPLIISFIEKNINQEEGGGGKYKFQI